MGPTLKSASASLLLIRGCHLVAEFREDLFTHLHEGLFVIDEEDPLGAGGELVVTDRIGFEFSLKSLEDIR